MWEFLLSCSQTEKFSLAYIYIQLVFWISFGVLYVAILTSDLKLGTSPGYCKWVVSIKSRRERGVKIGESVKNTKVSQRFYKISVTLRHNSAALDIFAKDMKVTNNTGW